MQRPVAGSVADTAAWARTVVERVERAIVGKRATVEQCLVAAVAGGHLLIEDAPGVGKTTLARSLAGALGLSFARVQCTSDLLPSDILGVNVFEQATGKFQFRAGPIFHEVVLVDELNRASPRTQSALLEAMAEGSVSLEGQAHALPRPFVVLATQNPLEHAGTYPLPDSQLDRFLMRVSLGYPPGDAERRLVEEDGRRAEAAPLPPPGDGAAALLGAQAAARTVRVAPEIADYLMRLVEATRHSPHLAMGASTRGALLLARAVRARCLLRGRDYALPDDVKALLAPCLGHRLTLAGNRQGRLAETDRILADIAERTPVP
ncbi:MAG TPA: AAA family ATPase [Myxococcales bacterium]|nr:AAA family ATPase [Myxococcales bacterium]